MCHAAIIRLVVSKIWNCYAPDKEVLLEVIKDKITIDTKEFCGEVDFIFDIERKIIQVNKEKNPFRFFKNKKFKIIRFTDLFTMTEWNRTRDNIVRYTKGRWYKAMLSFFRGEIIYRTVQLYGKEYLIGYIYSGSIQSVSNDLVDINVLYQMNGYERFVKENAFIIIDKNKEIAYISEEFQKLVYKGLDQNWKIGESFANYVEKLFAGGLKNNELERIRKNINNAYEGIASNDVHVLRLPSKNHQFFVMYYPIYNYGHTVESVVVHLVDLDKKNMMLANGSTNALDIFTHEIRDPLNKIIDNCEMLNRNEYIDKEKLNKRVKYIKNLSFQMLTLSEYMTRKAFDEKNFCINLNNKIDIKSVIQEIYESYIKEAVDKGLYLNLDLSEECKYIWSNETLLRQIIINLVKNGIKYTFEGGVTIRTLAKENQLLFEVCDSGIGIDSRYFKKIFQKGYRIENEKVIDGSGFGLMIVKQLAKELDSELTVSSTVGIGTTFTLYFKRCVSESVELDWITEKKISILIADDDEINRYLLSAYLRDMGVKVVSCESGEEALLAFRKNYFDAVITDIYMQGISGYEVARQIREINTKTKIISCSSESVSAILVNENASFFDESILKPIGKSDVMSLLKMLKDI